MSNLNVDPEKIRDGDTDELAKLFEWLLPHLLLRATQMNLRKEEAEDLVASAILELFASLPRYEFKDEAEFLAYAFVALQKEVQYYKSKRKSLTQETVVDIQDLESLLPAESVFPSDVAQVDHNILEQAISRLPDTQQKVFIYYYMQTRSVEEIAAEIGISSSRARAVLYRTIKLLRELVLSEQALADIGM